MHCGTRVVVMFYPRGDDVVNVPTCHNSRWYEVNPICWRRTQPGEFFCGKLAVTCTPDPM